MLIFTAHLEFSKCAKPFCYLQSYVWFALWGFLSGQSSAHRLVLWPLSPKLEVRLRLKRCLEGSIIHYECHLP